MQKCCGMKVWEDFDVAKLPEPKRMVRIHSEKMSVTEKTDQEKKEALRVVPVVEPVGNCPLGEMPAEESVREWQVAEYLLRQYTISPVQAVRFVLEALDATSACRIADESESSRMSHIIRMGCESYAVSHLSVSFRELVEHVLHHKSYRRERTLKELTQYCRRLQRQDPSWSERMVRTIRSDDCRNLINKAYSTPTMRRKARTILHGVFAYALKKGWCATNPVAAIELPPPRERQIKALSIQKIRKLLMTSLAKKHLPCAPALGLLLWAGIRPNELERLHWSNIRFEDKVITIPPTHSKTGGARQVSLYPALKNWLERTSSYRLPDAPIIPMSWIRRWRELRRDAGFDEWEADILRHTFASYHLKYFRNLNELQIDMGHGSTDLLRTRYISMDNVTKNAAYEFWHISVASLLSRLKKSAENVE